MHPLHKAIFGLLKMLPADGTFNQIAPVERLYTLGHKSFWCYDLSAATDRLPVLLQSALLDHLLGNSIGQLWAAVLTRRNYYLPKVNRKEMSCGPVPQYIKYAVGQPMGALSS